MPPTLQPRDGEPYYEGDALVIPIEITQADGETPQDLTGATVTFHAKRRQTDDDADALLSKSSANPDDGLTVPDPLTGRVRLEIATGETDGFLDDGGDRVDQRDIAFVVRVTDADDNRVTPAGLAGTWPVHAS